MAKMLTAAAVRKLKPAGARREIADAGAAGLYLVIQPSGRKSWAMRFRRPDGTPAKLTLGPVDFSEAQSGSDPQIGAPLTVASARRLAADVHHNRARGRDVVVDIRTEKHRARTEVEQRTANSFGALALLFIAEHARPKTRGWKETASVLGLRYVKDGDEGEVIAGGLAQIWADRPVAEITGHDIYSVVEDAKRHGIPGLKRRRSGPSGARARKMIKSLSKFFTWNIEHRRIAANPCIGIKAEPPSSRDRVLTSAEIAAFWKAASMERPEFAAPLKLLLLTGQRLREITGMRRQELSEDLSTWTIPGARTKNHRTHVVALPPLARDLIASMRDGELVFTTNGRVPVILGSAIKARLDAAMKIPPWRIHDLRRTAVTHLAELGVRPDVIELAVNHVSGARGGIAGIYNRSELLAERRSALERWANHVEGLVSGRPTMVVPIRGRTT